MNLFIIWNEDKAQQMLKQKQQSDVIPGLVPCKWKQVASASVQSMQGQGIRAPENEYQNSKSLLLI